MRKFNLLTAIIPLAVLASTLLAGCDPAPVEAQVNDKEKQIAALEQKIAQSPNPATLAKDRAELEKLKMEAAKGRSELEKATEPESK